MQELPDRMKPYKVSLEIFNKNRVQKNSQGISYNQRIVKDEQDERIKNTN
jgi:hypothetical protein